jgi:hypothetical protein
MAFIHRETFEIINDRMECEFPFIKKHFHADDLIALTIQILNRKGYTTEGCCSGHLFFGGDINEKPKNLRSYINFEEGISLPSLPPGFVWLRSTCISYDYHIPYEYNVNAMFEILRENLEIMEKLYNWALKLPIL